MLNMLKAAILGYLKIISRGSRLDVCLTIVASRFSPARSQWGFLLKAFNGYLIHDMERTKSMINYNLQEPEY